MRVIVKFLTYFRKRLSYRNAVPDEDENKVNLTHPYTPSKRGIKNQIMKGFSKIITYFGEV